MSLRFRLFLWLILALGLLLIPLGFLTAREAQRAARGTLEQALLLRLGLLQAQGVSLKALAQLVQEFGGVGFEVRGGRAQFTDQGDYRLPDGLLQTVGEGLSFREVRGETLWVALPGDEAALGLGVPLGEVAELPRRLLLIYLSVGGGLALLAFAVGAWGLARSLAPIEQLSQDLGRRGPENLEPLLPPALPEARPAVRAMNALMGELSAAFERLKTQEQAARRFAYGASHELRNPLAALKGYLEVLTRRPGEKRALDGAVREAGRMESLLGGLLTLARLEGRGLLESPPLDLKAFVLERFALEAEGSGVARADPALLEVAVENLLKNARKHGGGLEKLRLEPSDGGVWLWAYDRGPGFRPEVLPRAFEAFVKKDDSDGVGLGLALVAAVAQGLGGWARAENRPEGGSRVGVWLPSA